MKKLMFSAAAAAMASGAFALNTPEVYEMSMTIKTTACKVGQSKNVCDYDIDTYRVKATQTVKGLFWGCDCPTIAEPVPFTTFSAYGTEDACHGYVFWNSKDKTPFGTAEFTWEFLQCINAKMTEVEGTWDLVLHDLNDKEVVNIRGAGMGSAKWNKDYLAAYISSMSGNLAGAAMPGALSYGCAACGGLSEGCSAWSFCTECEEVDQDAFSTAYGTWTLKINSSAAKKYAQKSILDSYKFPDAVKAYLVAVDAGSEPVEPTPVEKAKAQLAKAQADYVAASNASAVAVMEYYQFLNNATYDPTEDNKAIEEAKKVRKAADEAYAYDLEDAKKTLAKLVTDGVITVAQGQAVEDGYTAICNGEYKNWNDAKAYLAELEVRANFADEGVKSTDITGAKETVENKKIALDDAIAAFKKALSETAKIRDSALAKIWLVVENLFKVGTAADDATIAEQALEKKQELNIKYAKKPQEGLTPAQVAAKKAELEKAADDAAKAEYEAKIALDDAELVCLMQTGNRQCK